MSRSKLALLLVLSCARAQPPTTPKPPAPAPDPAKTYWQGRKDLIQPPPPPAPKELALPAIERWKLRNGLDVIVVPRSELPVATFGVAIKAGAYDEQRSSMGLASFTAEMLRKGTASRSADDIAEAIDSVGGSLETGAGSESSRVDCTVLAKDSALCLDLIADLLLHPTFPEDEMGEIRDQMLGGIRQRYDDPGSLAQAHFENLVFGDQHPDGWALMPDDVQRIKRADLQRFWKTYYRPGNALLVAAGDVDARKLRAELDKRLARWPAGGVPARPAFVLPERKGTRFLLVDKPDLTQATLAFGHRGIRHADPAWYDVTMMNYVLGGSDFSSRLMIEVRAKRGLTYNIRSSFGASLSQGVFEVTAATRNEMAWPALLASVEEIRKMKASGPTEEELAKARGFFAGSHPFQLQSAASVASNILGAELHGLGVAYVKQLAVRLARVDVARARAAAEEYLHPEDQVVVIVGQGTVVGPQLEKAKMKFERINYRDPISYGERARLRRGADTPEDKKKAVSLLERALAAQGGAARLRAVKDLTVVKTGVRKQGDLVIDLASTTYYRRPDSVRIEQTMIFPGKKSESVVVVTPRAVKAGAAGKPLQAVPAGNEKELRSAAFEDTMFLLLNLLDAKPERPLQPVPSIEDGGRTLDGVAVQLPSGDSNTLYFDRASHLLVRIKTPGEGGADQIEEIGDYREVGGGLKLPFRLRSLGAFSSEATVTQVKVDAGLAAKLFD
jgi:zinc protease